MLYGNLKKTLRLHRTIALAFGAYAAIALWASTPETTLPLWRGVTWLVVCGIFLLANELGRLGLRKLPEADTLLIEKISVFIPLGLFCFTILGYLLSGNPYVALSGMFSVLVAHLYGQYQISKGLLVANIIMLAALWPLGYPAHPVLLSPLPQALMLLPIMVCIFHYGAFVCAIVKTTTSQVSRLQSLAATDALTGLINRRQFNHQLHAEIARARRHQAPLSLALFDLDNFKRINDFYGHPVGDRILRELGALVADNVRDSDIPARYGGEEFALILPETRQVEAFELLERLRCIIERTVFCLPDNPMAITISVGVAQLDLEHHTSFELVEQADAALYEAKKQGKNRVIYGVVPTPKVSVPPAIRTHSHSTYLPGGYADPRRR